MKTASSIALALFASALLVAAAPSMAQANSDCLACHADAGLQDASGRRRQRGRAKVWRQHPRQPGMRQLPRHHQGVSPSGEGHAGQVRFLPRRSGGWTGRERPLQFGGPSLHQLPWRCPFHLSQSDPRLAVYPLNVPRTCGNCHGNDGMAKKHGLASVYPLYVDSIHGFALSKEGLLVAANCQSCHGSHHILSRKDRRAHQQGQRSGDLRNLPCRNHQRLLGRRTWEGHCERPSGCAGVLRLPHRALH